MRKDIISTVVNQTYLVVILVTLALWLTRVVKRIAAKKCGAHYLISPRCWAGINGHLSG